MVGPRTQQWRGPYIHQANVHPVPLGQPELLANLTMRMLWCSAALRLAFLLPTIGTSAPSPPTELFSPLVAEKVLRTALSPPTPAQYPQYTDRAAGDWLYFAPDTWTSGFFPATLYALHARAQLCRWPAANAAQWLALGRRWSAAEVPLAADNTVGHDVGFLSYPFVAELAVCVLPGLARRAVRGCLLLTVLRQQSTQRDCHHGREPLCVGPGCALQSRRGMHPKLGHPESR